MSTHCCSGLTDAITNSNGSVVFNEKFREYGISVLDGGNSFIAMNFCPWCGVRFPPSLRDEWFDQLEKLGIDPEQSVAIPLPYRSGAWYQSNE